MTFESSTGHMSPRHDDDDDFISDHQKKKLFDVVNTLFLIVSFEVACIQSIE